MQSLDNNTRSFLALVRAGLWEQDVRLLPYQDIEWQEVYRLATEQSVLGLVLAGLEHSDVKPPQVLLLQWIGEVQMIEQRNKAMNAFVSETIDTLREQDIYALLVKGQGIAQCYEKPLWRPSGDIDFFLSKDNYGKAVSFFKNRYSNNKDGGQYSQEYAFYTDQWMIEVHGSLRTCLSSSIDKEIDTVQKSVFYGGNVRSWDNNGTLVFLPAPTEDVFLVFTHFIKHFYKEGMNLRQVCDWCRLLWTYGNEIKPDVLEKRLRKAGLTEEWKAFAALAVDYLDMPKDSMPLYDESNKWHKKASLLVDHILKGGSLGTISETWSIARRFPFHTLKFLPAIFFNLNGLKIKERLLGQ